MIETEDNQATLIKRLSMIMGKSVRDLEDIEIVSLVNNCNRRYLANSAVHEENRREGEMGRGCKVKDLVHGEDDFERACSGRRDSSLAMIFDRISID